MLRGVNYVVIVFIYSIYNMKYSNSCTYFYKITETIIKKVGGNK